MNRLDLIQALKDSNNLSRSEAEKIVTLFFDQMVESLAQGDRVEIRGLCSIHVKRYRGYTGRDPRTGEMVQIAPKKLPVFKVGKELGIGSERARQMSENMNAVRNCRKIRLL